VNWQPEQWQQLDDMLYAARELAPRERATFLDEVCAGNESLRRLLGNARPLHVR
jgi:hypothetical protein